MTFSSLPCYSHSIFHTAESTSAYPAAFPSAFASWTIAPHVALVGTYLLHRPIRKSVHGVSPFRITVCRCFRPALYAGLLVV